MSSRLILGRHKLEVIINILALNLAQSKKKKAKLSF